MEFGVELENQLVEFGRIQSSIFKLGLERLKCSDRIKELAKEMIEWDLTNKACIAKIEILLRRGANVDDIWEESSLSLYKDKKTPREQGLATARRIISNKVRRWVNKLREEIEALQAGALVIMELDEATIVASAIQDSDQVEESAPSGGEGSPTIDDLLGPNWNWDQIMQEAFDQLGHEDSPSTVELRPAADGEVDFNDTESEGHGEDSDDESTVTEAPGAKRRRVASSDRDDSDDESSVELPLRVQPARECGSPERWTPPTVARDVQAEGSVDILEDDESRKVLKMKELIPIYDDDEMNKHVDDIHRLTSEIMEIIHKVCYDSPDPERNNCEWQWNGRYTDPATGLEILRRFIYVNNELFKVGPLNEVHEEDLLAAPMIFFDPIIEVEEGRVFLRQ